MEKTGIICKALSHNLRMENQAKTINSTNQSENKICLQGEEAEEFRAYQKRKKINEITTRIARSQAKVTGAEDVQRVCERAKRLQQQAVLLPLTKLSQAKYYLSGSKVAIDCLVGGTGETTAKVKAYEGKTAVKSGAKEITLILAPSFVDCCRYSEIKREIKRVKRAIGRATLKVSVEKNYLTANVLRIARIVGEAGAKYFCVPYFSGCEKIRLELTGGCKLQINGVEDLSTFKTLSTLGIPRITTGNGWEIYNEWLQEKLPTIEPEESQPEEKPSKKTSEEKPSNQTETDYHCKLVGTELKFF